MSQPGGKETTLLEAVWLLCGRGSASRYLHGWCAGPFHLTEEVLFPVMLFWLALVGSGSSSSAGLLVPSCVILLRMPPCWPTWRKATTGELNS